jgi:hypothetical protein
MVCTPYVDKHIYGHSFHWLAILMLGMFGTMCNKICISKQYAWCIYNEQTEHSWMKKELLLFLFTSVTKPEVQDTGTEIYHSLLSISMFLSSFSNKLIKSEWNSLQMIIFKAKHTWKNFFARQEMQEI